MRLKLISWKYQIWFIYLDKELLLNFDDYQIEEYLNWNVEKWIYKYNYISAFLYTDIKKKEIDIKELKPIIHYIKNYVPNN